MNENEVKNTQAESTGEKPDSQPSQDKIWGADGFDDDVLLGQPKKSASAPASSYRKRKQRRSFPFFYAIYGVLVTAAIVAIFCVCGYVNTLLSEYETVQPKYKAEEVFEEYFKNPDISELMTLADGDFAEFETRENVTAHLAEQITGGVITYAETLKKGDGERIYAVYSDGKRFATFSLVEGEESTEHGFKYFTLGTRELQLTLPDNEYIFMLPERYTLYVNGIAVSEKYRTEKNADTDAYALSEGKAGVRYVEYSVGGFLTTPEFEVKNEQGKLAAHYWVEEAGNYTVDMPSLTVRIPKGYVPYIDGHAVGEQFILADVAPIPSAYNKFLSKDAEGLNYIDYKIGGFYSDTVPVVSAKSKDGFECIVKRIDEGDESDDGVFSSYEFECSPAYNTSLKSEHETEIREFFRNYTLYLMYVNVTSDGKPMDRIVKGHLKPSFDTDSSAWKAFNSIQVIWQFEPTKYEFADESIDSFIMYPDGTFSCRVKQTYNSWRRNAVYSQSIDKTVFYKNTDGKWLIYELINTEAIQGLGQPEN